MKKMILAASIMAMSALASAATYSTFLWTVESVPEGLSPEAYIAVKTSVGEYLSFSGTATDIAVLDFGNGYVYRNIIGGDARDALSFTFELFEGASEEASYFTGAYSYGDLVAQGAIFEGLEQHGGSPLSLTKDDFSQQVPEPTSGLLTLLGLAMLGLKRKKLA